MQKIKKHLTMKELPVTERPYEKCEEKRSRDAFRCGASCYYTQDRNQRGQGDGSGCTTAEFESILSGP